MRLFICAHFVFFIFLTALGQEKTLCDPVFVFNSNCEQNINNYTSIQQFNIIHSLNEQERYNEALEVIDELPLPNTAILLEKARAQKALGFSSKSNLTYKEALKENPGWNIARLKQMNIHKKQGKKRQVLNGNNKSLYNEFPYELRQDLQASQQQLSYNDKDWYLNFLLSSYYDANINKSPNEGNIYIQGYLFNFEEPIAAYVLAPEAKAGYQWNISPYFSWQIHVGSVLQKPFWSSEEIDKQYDKLKLQLQTGPAYNKSNKHISSLQFYMGKNYQDWKKESGRVGLQSRYGYYISPFSFYVSHDFSMQDYQFNALDAKQNRININFIHKNSLNKFNLGLEHILHNARNHIHSYQSFMGSFVWENKYSYNIRSTFSGFYIFRKYKGYSSLFGSKRQDDEIGVFWNVGKMDWQIFNIIPYMKYGYISTYSNQKVFEKNQHMLSIYGQIDF